MPLPSSSSSSSHSLKWLSNRAEQVPLLIPQEALALWRQWKEGDESAQNKLVEGNYRLVLRLVYQYAQQCSVSPSVLCDAALDGLLDAIPTYDDQRGLAFGQFAAWKIKGKILKAIPKAKRKDASLDDALSDEDDETWLDRKASSAGEESFAEFDKEKLRAILKANKAHLTGREAYVIKSRFLDQPTLTLQGIANNLDGLSRERVRQIEAAALEKLRKALSEDPEYTEKLKQQDEKVNLARFMTQTRDVVTCDQYRILEGRYLTNPPLKRCELAKLLNVNTSTIWKNEQQAFQKLRAERDKLSVPPPKVTVPQPVRVPPPLARCG